MARTLLAAWDVGFLPWLMRGRRIECKKSDELGAMIFKLRSGDDEMMSIETYIRKEGEEITDLELKIDELVDACCFGNLLCMKL